MTTSKDKTGDQLVASMRKTKSGAEERQAATQNTAEKPEVKPQKKAKVTEKKTSVAKTASVKNGYSSGRRVWPD